MLQVYHNKVDFVINWQFMYRGSFILHYYVALYVILWSIYVPLHASLVPLRAHSFETPQSTESMSLPTRINWFKKATAIFLCFNDIAMMHKIWEITNNKKRQGKHKLTVTMHSLKEIFIFSKWWEMYIGFKIANDIHRTWRTIFCFVLRKSIFIIWENILIK